MIKSKFNNNLLILLPCFILPTSYWGILECIKVILCYITGDTKAFSNNYIVLCIILESLIFSLIIIKFIKTHKNLFYKIDFKLNLKISTVINITLLSIGLTMILIFLIEYVFSISTISSNKNSIFVIILICLISPISEEILYRGAIFSYLRKNYSLKFSIFTQALIFSIFHFDIIQSMYTFILGIILGVIYRYTNSLIGVILMHMLFNIFGTFILPYLSSKFYYSNIILFILGIFLLTYSSIKIHKNKPYFYGD